MANTRLENLINPQVLAQYLEVKLMDAVKFAPMAVVNNDLQGNPGDTLSIPAYAFIGLADDVAEGEDIPMSALSATKVDVKVKKAGKGVTVTDEALLSAYGDTEGEVAKQLLMAIAGKVDNDCVEALRGATLAHECAAIDKDAVADALVKFGEDLEEECVLFVNAAHYATLRKDDDFVHIMDGQAIVTGEIGRIHNCRIVVSNKVQAAEAFIVKAGALGIVMKRNVMVEADRNIVNKTNTYVADEHYAAYLRDASKAIKITIA